MYNPKASGVCAGRGFVSSPPGCMSRHVPMPPQARSRATPVSSTATPSPSVRRASGSRASMPRFRPDLPAQMVRVVAVRERGNGSARRHDRQPARELRAARPRQVRAHAGCMLRRRPRHQCADGSAGLRLGLRQILLGLREGGGGGRSRRPRHLAGRGGAGLGVPRQPLGHGQHAAPEGCAIKGNVTRNGRIYHMPWSPWYAQIKMEPDKGKRWFCSEAEAVAAGWRPVLAH